MATGNYDEDVTEWIHAVVNINATEPHRILFKAYDYSGPQTDISLDDIRLVDYQCGKTPLLLNASRFSYFF